MEHRSAVRGRGRRSAAIALGLTLSLGVRAHSAPRVADDQATWVRPDAAQATAPAYPDMDRRSVYVRMRDGVRLAADIWLPKGLAPGLTLPTILEQTRYYRSATVKTDASGACHPAGLAALKTFVTHGYAYVVVDVRGTGASFGSRAGEYSDAEVKDGTELVDWIVRQPWSDGKIGATGQSYVGTTAELLLRNHKTAVKAVMPTFSGYDFYSEIAQPGGIQNTAFDEHWPAGNHALDVGEPLQPTPIVGVCPVDADTDRSLLKTAIAQHAGNLGLGAAALGQRVSPHPRHPLLHQRRRPLERGQPVAAQGRHGDALVPSGRRSAGAHAVSGRRRRPSP